MRRPKSHPDIYEVIATYINEKLGPPFEAQVSTNNTIPVAIEIYYRPPAHPDDACWCDTLEFNDTTLLIEGDSTGYGDFQIGDLEDPTFFDHLDEALRRHYHATI